MAAIPSIDKITQASAKTGDQTILETKYGDGYTQTAKWGINASRQRWTLVWEGLTLTERNAWYAHFDTVGLFDVSDWQSPGDATSLKWRFTTFPVENINGNLYNITIDIAQEFRL